MKWIGKEEVNRWIYFLKYPFKLWAYELIDQWVMQDPVHTSKKVLLFRLDLIGDYLMTRPFFESLRKDGRWLGYQFYFAGNQQVKDLALSLDKSVFDGFYWIDRSKFINSLGYRFRVLKEIRNQGFEVVLYPSHTRQYWLESVVRVTGASRKYCGQAVGKYMSDYEKYLTDSLYSEMVPTGEGVVFEFYRNRSFFAYFSSYSADVQSLRINSIQPEKRNETGFTIAFAMGASTPERRWPVAAFARLARKLHEQFAPEFYLLGGKAEGILESGLKTLLPEISFQCLSGKLSISESMQVLGKVDLLISNESAPVHMAATMGTPCVCISQGNHFGRWNPYPSEIAPQIQTVYPPFFGDPSLNVTELTKRYHDGSDVDVSLIPVDQVWRAALAILTGSRIISRSDGSE